MRKATAISAGLHAAVLLWATLSFSGKSFDVTPAESLPVDFISEKDFSEMTKGVKDAPKVETPKPLVEKKAEEPPKPIEEAKPKVTEKKELQAAKEAAPPPEPQPPKPDQIVEKLKHQDEPKKAKTEPQPLPPKKPPMKPQPKFEPDKIAALLDKRDPRMQSVTRRPSPSHRIRLPFRSNVVPLPPSVLRTSSGACPGRIRCRWLRRRSTKYQ